MTPEQLRDKIKRITDNNPLPPLDLWEIGKILTTRRDLLSCDAESMELEELRQVVEDVAIWGRLPAWATRVLACELLVRIDKINEEAHDQAIERDLAEVDGE